jgi:hypothetical protein
MLHLSVWAFITFQHQKWEKLQITHASATENRLKTQDFFFFIQNRLKPLSETVCYMYSRVVHFTSTKNPTLIAQKAPKSQLLPKSVTTLMRSTGASHCSTVPCTPFTQLLGGGFSSPWGHYLQVRSWSSSSNSFMVVGNNWSNRDNP